jgi:hypothetical protein
MVAGMRRPLAAALLIPAIAAVSLMSLAGLGALGVHLGGVPLGRAAARMTVGGAPALARLRLSGESSASHWGEEAFDV